MKEEIDFLREKNTYLLTTQADGQMANGCTQSPPLLHRAHCSRSCCFELYMLLIGLNWLPVAAQIKFVHSIIQVYAPFGAPRSSQERHLALPSLVSFIA